MTTFDSSGLTLEIDEPEFKATVARESVHAGRLVMYRQCFELIEGRWEGFVSMSFVDA